MKLFRLTVAVVAAVCSSVGCIASETEDIFDQGAAIPTTMEANAAAVEELLRYFPEARQAMADQLIWIADKQAEATRLGLKIEVQSTLFPNENKIEFGWCVSLPNGEIGDGVFTLFDLDYPNVETIQRFCSEGRTVISDSLRGLTNLFRVMHDFLDRKISGNYVQFRRSTAHYMDPVLVDNLPEQREKGDYMSIEEVLEKLKLERSIFEFQRT
ncbi:MAG: hypothetical protein LBT03_02150 [Holosporales bacterium]|jgi:hypothetical protein|nr:hypothetical protein [Holosporales bacterium]